MAGIVIRSAEMSCSDTKVIAVGQVEDKMLTAFAYSLQRLD
jgi:hypothetical protein